MGLSRKLGTSSSRPAELEGTAIPYKWSTQTYTIAELLSKFKLPCVVQCATDSCSVVWSDFQFDLRQPLLLFEKRTVQKVHAVSVSVPKTRFGSTSSQDDVETLEEVGPPMAIPCDYDGWFGAAPKGQPKAVRHTRVEGVAKSSARRFLVTTKLPAFTSSRAAGGTGSGDLDDYVSHDILPGEVLKRVCVLDPNPGDPDCPKIVRHNGPCLECLDEKDEDVLIPLSRRAIIYEVTELYPDDIERVFTMRQVVAAGNKRLPRIFKLAHGDPPLLAYAFTGMLRCYSVFTEETILASTLDDVASICLELATDSRAKFRLCLNESAMKRTCEYGNALQMCDTFGAKFITGIKVSFSLQPELLDVDDVDASLYESQTSLSDMQEVEANSEFEISWNAVKKAKLFSSTEEHGQQDNGLDNSSSDENLSDKLTDFQNFDNGGDSDIYAVVKKKKAPTVSDSEQPRPFTEKDIADLMQRKGMISSVGSDNGMGSSLLDENQVRHNPLFYYFQREDEEKSESKGSDPQLVHSEIQTSGKDIQEKMDLVEDKTFKSKEENLPDIITSPVGQILAKGDEVEHEAEELDISEYEEAICTPAREYSENEITGSASSESDDDSDDVLSSFKKTNTEFPIEANVVIKSKPPTVTRKTMCLDFRRKTFDTSSSDDVNSDLDRFDESKNKTEIRERLFPLDNEKNYGGVVEEKRSPSKRKNTAKKPTPNINSSSTYEAEGLSFVNELDLGNNFQGSKTNSVDAGLDSFKPNPLRPTFTEVDDPLEDAISELDKITSIKPSGLTTENFENRNNEQGFTPSLSKDCLDKNDGNVKTQDERKIANDLSERLEDQRKLSLTKPRPEPPKGPIKKHADVMQTEDRFDSPKVSHHPHQHPHTTTALKSYSSELSHLGRWTNSVNLEGIEKNNNQVSNSIQGFERISSSNSSDSFVSRKSTGQKPVMIYTSQKSEPPIRDQVYVDNPSKSDKIKEMHQARSTTKNLITAKEQDVNTKSFNRSIYSRNLFHQDECEVPQDQSEVRNYTDSDEDMTTIEEHFVVSTDSIKSPGTNLKVLPVYHEDLTHENYI